VRPQPLLNRDIKVNDNKQKLSIARHAETEADSELLPIIEASKGHCCPFSPLRTGRAGLPSSGSCYSVSQMTLSFLR